MITVGYDTVVGQVLRQQRKRHEVPVEKLARAVGVHRTGWSRVETGGVEITLVRLRQVAPLFNLSPVGLLHLIESTVAWITALGVVVTDYEQPSALGAQAVRNLLATREESETHAPRS